MREVAIAQDLVDELEGMMDSEVVVVVQGVEKLYSIIEVYRPYRNSARVILRCEEKETT